METFNWIKDFWKNKTDDTSSIHGIIPDVFANYYVINWNYGIIDNFPFDDYPVDPDNIRDINEQVSINRQFGVLLKSVFKDAELEKLYRQTTIEEIATKFNVPHAIDTVNKIIHTPGISRLPTVTKNNLSKSIQLISNDGLYLYHHDSGRFDELGDWKFKMENSIEKPADYIYFLEQTGFDSTSYLFDSNHSWCLATIEDFNYFIFCADNETADKLKLIPELEAFKVKSDYKLWPNI